MIYLDRSGTDIEEKIEYTSGAERDSKQFPRRRAPFKSAPGDGSEMIWNFEFKSCSKSAVAPLARLPGGLFLGPS